MRRFMFMYRVAIFTLVINMFKCEHLGEMGAGLANKAYGTYLSGGVGVQEKSTKTTPNQKMKLTIAIMLPQDYIRLRNFNVCINKEMNRINKGNWSFIKHFYLDSYTIIIDKNFKDIAETICTLLNTQSNTAIYINYNDYSQIEALNSRLFLKFASFINIPVMTYIPNAYATNRPRKNEIQLSPTMYHQVEAMMSLMARYEWFKYSIIVTDYSGSDEFLKAAENLQTSHLSHKNFEILSIIKLKLKKNRLNRTEIMERFKRLAPETRVIFLHCHIEETSVIFDMANHLGLMTYEYMWLFTKNVIETQLFSNYKYNHFPIGSLALWSNYSADGICDTTLYDSMRLWASAVDSYYHSIDHNRLNTILPHTHCWNASNVNMNNIKYHYGKNFHEYLLKASINKGVERGIMRFNESGVLDSVEFKIWNLNHKYQWKQVGSWLNKEIIMDDLIWPGKQHKPPLGRPVKFHLNIVTLEEPPFVIYKHPNQDGNCSSNSLLVRIVNNNNQTLNKSNPDHYRCASGFYVDLVIYLSEKLQFTYEIYEVEDKAWGAKGKNGDWNGIMRDLITHKADMAMTSLTITTERVDIIDFSVPFMETGIAILVSLRPGTISTTAFLKPYDYLIWIMLLLVTLHSVAISLFLFEWITTRIRNSRRKNKYAFEYVENIDSSPYKEILRNKLSMRQDSRGSNQFKAFALIKVNNTRQFSFGRALWLVWVLLFRAATKAQQPKTFASKFMANIWACLCLAFTASYTANLAAFMIIREEYPDLKGVEDPRLTSPYSYKPAYRFGTVASSSTEEVIKKTYPNMHEYMKKFSTKNITHGIELVKKMELDAFLYDAVILDYRAGQDDGCKLRLVGSWYSMTGYGIALTKGSKYKDAIDRKLIEYAYSGDLERTQRFWFTGTCKNLQEENTRNSDQFGLLQSSSVFILLLTGIIIGILILISHRLFRKYIKTKFINVWLYDSVKGTGDDKKMLPTNDCKNGNKLVVIKKNCESKSANSLYVKNQCRNCDPEKENLKRRVEFLMSLVKQLKEQSDEQETQNDQQKLLKYSLGSMADLNKPNHLIDVSDRPTFERQIDIDTGPRTATTMMRSQNIPSLISECPIYYKVNASNHIDARHHNGIQLDVKRMSDLRQNDSRLSSREYLLASNAIMKSTRSYDNITSDRSTNKNEHTPGFNRTLPNSITFNVSSNFINSFLTYKDYENFYQKRLELETSL